MDVARYRLVPITALTTVALVITSLAAHPADGQAVVGRFEFQDTYSDTGGNECLRPELTGTVTGTVTGHGQFVLSGPESSPGFREHLTATLEYRIDFPNGSYALGTAVEHHVRTFRPQNSRTTTATVTIRESRILYAADGRPTGRVMIHYLLHLTFRDINGNNEPDPGETTASIEHVRVTCF